MKVIVDAFGGDNAPLEILKGSVLAQQELGVEIILCGRTQEIEKCAKENEVDISKMEIIEAPDIVTMDTAARDIVKSSSNSSMAVGLKELSNGKGDAFVSAGSTGALVMGATFFVKRIKGVKRASLATIIPSNNKPFMLVDCGANVECTPEMLCGFAVMGSIYMNKVQGVQEPCVGILNIGTEESKGTELQQKTYEMLKKEGKVNFIGNVEARDVPSGIADVVVCDGFTGNIFLKTFEGVANVIMKNIKQMFTKNIFTKLSSLAINGEVAQFKKKMDYSEFGGAPLMGISKPVIKAHGSSNAKSFKNAIRQAYIYAQQDVINTIADNLPQEKIKEIDE